MMSTNISKENLPVHNFEREEFPVQLKKLSHKNNYDFTQKHRHNYFEVIFFFRGGGTQLIDFIEYEVKSNSCYIIYPHQIHLLQRTPDSDGFVLQFQEESISDAKLQKLLQERAWQCNGAIFFEEEQELMKKFEQLIHVFCSNERSGFQYEKDARYPLLHAVLYNLVSIVSEAVPIQSFDADLGRFFRLIDLHFHEKHTVKYYVDHLPISEKKLRTLTKKYLGISPLQAIHKRILLEAKRLLVFGEQSHKEIALDLGFDSPASFSAFIKKKTRHTASEIQSRITGIHNR